MKLARRVAADAPRQLLRWAFENLKRMAVGACLFGGGFTVSDASRRSCQFQNMHAGVGPVNDVNVAACVDFHVVGLNRALGCCSGVRQFADLAGSLTSQTSWDWLPKTRSM